MTALPKVVVLGGGFAGLEAAFYLRLRAGDALPITLISDRDYFLFRPHTVYIPFGLDPERLKIPLDPPATRRKILFAVSAAREIDPVARRVYTDTFQLRYDVLFVATGAGMRPSEIPGLAEHALTIWTPADMLRLRAAFASLAEDGTGRRRRVLFLVPPNNKYSGPLYEMAFMLDAWLRRRHVRERVDITWSTCEEGFLAAFGPRLNEVIGEGFQRRGILFHRQATVKRVEANEVIYAGGLRLPYDVLIAFSPYVASTPFAGLPTDARGFVATEPATRRVAGHPEIYAIGDTADFPVKQAYLAFLQADAAGAHLVAQLQGTKPEIEFEPTSISVMEQFDTATFAQVPLRETGRPEQPVEVRTDAAERYRVGVSPAWRVGKKLLGAYMPWRFGDGNPFRAGLPWTGMEAGLKVMSRVLAS